MDNSTLEYTTLTTSTVTVTEECGGECAGQTVTVTGPATTIGTTTEVDITYVSSAPPFLFASSLLPHC